MMQITFKVTFVVQVALFCQPDAKIANGIFWANFWLHLAHKIVS